LNRDSSYSPSVTAGLGGFIREPRGFSLGSWNSAAFLVAVSLTHLDDSDTEVDEIVDGILFRNRKSCVLIQPPPILVRHSLSEEDI
jgi:hypothetical protein